MNHATTLRPHSSRFVLALACLWLGACATVPKTEAPPRIAHAELAIAADHRLGYRVAWPARGSKLPLVLFSHGAYSSGDAYDPILDAWAAHGYVVISVTHRDSVSLGVKRGTNEPRYFAWRLDDMQAVLAALPTVLRNADPAGDLLRRSNLTRIAATGHSFGGLVAQTEGGATYFDAGAGTTRSRFDPRVRAVIIMSGAGPFPPTLRPSDFATLRVPTLVTVGTEDLAQAPGMSGWEWRRLPYELAAPGDKYRLTIRGADHYLGGSVGRDDLPRSPQAPEFQRLFNDVSLQFLDAHLRGDRTAQRALRTRAGDGVARDIDARATLERR